MAENNNENQNTSTTVVTVEGGEELKKIEVLSCIFLIFAEYLGYESIFMNWTEEWCTKGKLPEFKQNILFVEAKSILKKVEKDYEPEVVHTLYDQFYHVAIKKWETMLQENSK